MFAGGYFNTGYWSGSYFGGQQQAGPPPVVQVPTAPCSTTTFARPTISAPDWQHDFQPGTFAIARHRDEMPCYTRDASGDVYPCRFVTLVGDGQVRQSIPGELLYGISQEETRGAPVRPMLGQNDYRAAADGEPVFIYGPFAADVCLALGGSVKIGQRLTTDAIGRGIVATSGQWVLAIAEEVGSLGETRKVNVIEPQRMR